MGKQRPKRIGSVILWVIAYSLVVLDEAGRLRGAIALIPSEYSGHLPLVYGTLGLLALVLLRSAHKDDLEDAIAKRPRIKLEWPEEQAGVMRLHNDGDAAAYNLTAVIATSALYSIKIDPPVSRIAPGEPCDVIPTLDFDGPSRPAEGREEIIAFLRQAFPRRALDRHFAQADQLQRLMRGDFGPPPPDLSVRFDIAYFDAEGKRHTSAHTFTYRDKQSAIRIDLDTPEPTNAWRRLLNVWRAWRRRVLRG